MCGAWSLETNENAFPKDYRSFTIVFSLTMQVNDSTFDQNC